MIRLYDSESNTLIGEISELQFQFLKEMLEEESSEDRDYYISKDTLELFSQSGANPDFIELFRKALGDREGIEVRWE